MGSEILASCWNILYYGWVLARLFKIYSSGFNVPVHHKSNIFTLTDVCLNSVFVWFSAFCGSWCISSTASWITFGSVYQQQPPALLTLFTSRRLQRKLRFKLFTWDSEFSENFSFSLIIVPWKVFMELQGGCKWLETVRKKFQCGTSRFF